MPESIDDSSRTWPFTIRITRRERQLLAQAAAKQKLSRAEIARIGLNPLFAELQNVVGAASLHV